MTSSELEILAAHMGSATEQDAEQFADFLSDNGYAITITDSQRVIISIDDEIIDDQQFNALLDECF